MVVLYGIAHCDSVRRARRWLESAGVSYRFHDFRRDALPEGALARWNSRIGWQSLLNRRGTTWRQLPSTSREGVDAKGALALMAAQPMLIKRPVLEYGDAVLAGFSEPAYADLFVHG